MKRKNFIFLLFLVVLCLLGISSFNCIRTYALTNVPTNSFIGETEILPFYSDSNEYIEYGLAYNSYNNTNYFISTYYNKNQGFSYPNNSYYFWLYNFDLINSGNGEDNPPVEEVQQFKFVLDNVEQATFDFVVGQTWAEWVESGLNLNNVVTYDSTENAFYFNEDYIILEIVPSSLVLAQNYQIVLIEEPSNVPTDLTGLIVDVPSGWSASASYGIFSINGSIEYHDSDYIMRSYPLIQFAIGYNVAIDGVSSNLLSFAGSSGARYFTTTDMGFSITITGGSDVTNHNLIQWFFDNNATFSHATGGASLDDNIHVYSINRLDFANNFSSEELISYFKTCINWDFSILQRVITGTATLYLNYNGLWFSCSYNPYATSDLEMYLNFVYNPTLPTSTKENYVYGVGELTPYVLNAYNSYELRTNVTEELKEQQAYYESLLQQEKNNAFQNGYADGENYGYNQGYNVGYNTGVAEGIQQGSDGEFTLRSLLGTIFMFPLQILTIGMNVELFGINLGGVIMFLFALSIVAIVIKLIFKFLGR